MASQVGLSRIPEPLKYGWCRCCDKPMSEYDYGHSQGHHCAQCFANLVWDSSGFWCMLHESKEES